MKIYPSTENIEALVNSKEGIEDLRRIVNECDYGLEIVKLYVSEPTDVFLQKLAEIIQDIDNQAADSISYEEVYGIV